MGKYKKIYCDNQIMNARFNFEVRCILLKYHNIDSNYRAEIDNIGAQVHLTLVPDNKQPSNGHPFC